MRPGSPPDNCPARFDPPDAWDRGGLVLGRPDGTEGSLVAGDPCIVWDDDAGAWRMFLFYDPPGHGQAVCVGTDASDVGAGTWRFDGPLRFTNPAAVPNGFTHKPYVVQFAEWPNRAARVEGRYWLLGVCATAVGQQKFVQRAWAETLAGPWTWEPLPLILPGDDGAWDGKHVDAVTGLYLPDLELFVYQYMGYPRAAQPGRTFSPFGSAQGVAVQRVGASAANKIGVSLAPAEPPTRGGRAHWGSGWVGGMQVFRGHANRWVGLVNASPTAPVPDAEDTSIHREEPPPSLGGFVVSDAELPIEGWRWSDGPIEWADRIPPEAMLAGEGVNLWRHHALLLPDGGAALFYNSGTYGREQLYVKFARRRPGVVRATSLPVGSTLG